MRLDFDNSSSLLTGLLTVLVALLTRPFACRYSMSSAKALQESGSSGRLECFGSSKSSSTSRCYSCKHAKYCNAFVRQPAAISHHLHTSARARYSCSWQNYIHATICDLLFSFAPLWVQATACDTRQARNSLSQQLSRLVLSFLAT